MRYKLLIILFSFTVINISKACSCYNSPKTFFENITKDNIIIKAEIIGRENIPKGMIMSFKSLTKLKVSKSIKGKISTDTLFMINGLLGTCVANINQIPLREIIILKGKKYSFEDVYEEYKILNKNMPHDSDKFEDYFNNKKGQFFMISGTCDKWLLRYSNNKIYGDIISKEANVNLGFFKRKNRNKQERDKMIIIEEMGFKKFMRRLKRKKIKS